MRLITYLEAQVGAGGTDYDSHRAALGGFANGSTEGYEVDAMLGSGYDWKRNHFTVGTLAEMHYLYVDIEGFTESGSSSPLQVMENDSHSFWTLLGGRLACDRRLKAATLWPELRLGWRHEFMDTAQTIQAQMASGAGTVFQVESPSLGRDSLSIVAGLSRRLSQQFSIFTYYDGELARDNATSHSVNGGISWTFQAGSAGSRNSSEHGRFSEWQNAVLLRDAAREHKFVHECSTPLLSRHRHDAAARHGKHLVKIAV